ncbi:NUDIX hydrolase [Bogoriella caseilytica]|uniref:ADP-ribose pyrophosphatase YjhB (NUDIX family) n=1 Tax=Bogoriella caseilytica TaxID=56055 RepID=A0A3N2B918_9MICO|nr:NUDIX domain-containing protein [Bogoriella caseilytica]ROR71730.1 ADP-ribose pyrophosphatase YjhB (NUDIX family) [Bogoriella caseilytica]
MPSDRSAVTLAVSTVVFALRPDPATGALTLWLPLVRRIREPYEGMWALPGGPLGEDEDLAASARRTLDVTTGLQPHYLEQLYCFGDVDRSPSQRVVSVVYWTLVRADEDASALERPGAENVEWFAADDVATHPGRLAFDHTTILAYALDRLRAKITYSPIAHAFLPAEFTLAELRAVYEGVLRRPLDPANFRRQILAQGTVEPTGGHREGTRHRPPALYRSNPARSRATLTIPADQEIPS